MTRREALLALTIGFALITGALTWLFGPWGMFAAGVAWIACILLGFERVGDGEAVEIPVPQRDRHRIQI